MPVGGYAALCVQKGGQQLSAPKTTLYGDFSKIEFPPPFYELKGRLSINFHAYRISHGGIKVRLEGDLQVTQMIGRKAICKSVDILEHIPNEVFLTCDDLLRGQKKMSFTLKLPPNQVYPTSFVTSNGSLNYRLAAVVNRDNKWEVITRKLLNFKGYHNISGMNSNPTLDRKLLRDDKIVSVFTVPRVLVVMGRNECLKAILELHGQIENQVESTLSLVRNISYGASNHLDIIWSNSQVVQPKNEILFEWSFVVPFMSRASYYDELIPLYSVRYFLQYEVKLGESEGSYFKGLVEITVGTAYQPAAASCSNEATVREIQVGRRGSMMSTLSLPPSYSQIASRSGSVFSLETLPPRYDDL